LQYEIKIFFLSTGAVIFVRSCEPSLFFFVIKKISFAGEPAMLKKSVVLVSLLFLLPSCAAQKTVFFSDPPGARVVVNGEEIGETPCEYQYRTGTAKTYAVEVSKDDYRPVAQDIKTDQVDKQSREKWMAAGLVWSPLWLGALFTKKLQDTYHFVLTRIKNAEEPTAVKEHIPTPSAKNVYLSQTAGQQPPSS
jgi:hypothetical protein